MAAIRQSKQKLTPDEYLALEEQAEIRSEYESGETTAMAGSSISHARITTNISRFVGNKSKSDCESLSTDIKVWIDSYKKFYYPDVTVICSEPIFYKKRDDTITNPVLIFEVLSKSTEAKDRGEKFAAYQSLNSLNEYVLISQDKPKVEKFTRQNDGSWKYLAIIGLKSKFRLDSVNIELTLEEIYQRVKL